MCPQICLPICLPACQSTCFSTSPSGKDALQNASGFQTGFPPQLRIKFAISRPSRRRWKNSAVRQAPSYSAVGPCANISPTMNFPPWNWTNIFPLEEFIWKAVMSSPSASGNDLGQTLLQETKPKNVTKQLVAGHQLPKRPSLGEDELYHVTLPRNNRTASDTTFHFPSVMVRQAQSSAVSSKESGRRPERSTSRRPLVKKARPVTVEADHPPKESRPQNSIASMTR